MLKTNLNRFDVQSGIKKTCSNNFLEPTKCKRKGGKVKDLLLFKQTNSKCLKAFHAYSVSLKTTVKLIFLKEGSKFSASECEKCTHTKNEIIYRISTPCLVEFSPQYSIFLLQGKFFINSL